MSFKSPNHTQVPNDLFEVYLRDLGEAELRVMLSIIRQTLGFHRRRRRMSLTALQKSTGLSRTAVIAGTRSLEDRGLIRADHDGGTTEWEVLWEDEPPDMADVPSSLGLPAGADDAAPGSAALPGESTETTSTGSPTLPRSMKERTKETSKERDGDQTAWVQALAAIQSDRFPRRTPGDNFERYFQPTIALGLADGRFQVACEDEDQRAWLESNGWAIVENALVGVLGMRVKVEFVVEEA